MDREVVCGALVGQANRRLDDGISDAGFLFTVALSAAPLHRESVPGGHLSILGSVGLDVAV